MPLEGEVRCEHFGHEIDEPMEMRNGLIVGYCIRCSARFEMPWIRGGTATILAAVMAAEALRIENPTPGVLEDLSQVAGLLSADASAIVAAMTAVQEAAEVVGERMRYD